MGLLTSWDMLICELGLKITFNREVKDWFICCFKTNKNWMMTPWNLSFLFIPSCQNCIISVKTIKSDTYIHSKFHDNNWWLVWLEHLRLASHQPLRKNGRLILRINGDNDYRNDCNTILHFVVSSQVDGSNLISCGLLWSIILGILTLTLIHRTFISATVCMQQSKNAKYFLSYLKLLVYQEMETIHIKFGIQYKLLNLSREKY